MFPLILLTFPLPYTLGSWKEGAAALLAATATWRWLSLTLPAKSAEVMAAVWRPSSGQCGAAARVDG